MKFWNLPNIKQILSFVGQASRHYGLQRAVCHKTKWAITNHKARGLVKGSYSAEQSLPIGNPCDAELTNLMRCMRENDYDNIPCRGAFHLHWGGIILHPRLSAIPTSAINFMTHENDLNSAQLWLHTKMRNRNYTPSPIKLSNILLIFSITTSV